MHEFQLEQIGINVNFQHCLGGCKSICITIFSKLNISRIIVFMYLFQCWHSCLLTVHS